MLPVELKVQPANWRLFAARKADPAFLAFREKVFKRDNNTCQYCGFQASEFQEVLNKDQDYEKNLLANLVTACCFCSQCFFLETVGKNDYGGGTIIYMPEISQNELNALCHVLFCAITNATSYKSTAQTIYRSFRYRTQPVDDFFGAGASRAAHFGQMMLESEKTDHKVEKFIKDNLRLLPSHTKFRTQIETWAASAISELPEDSEQ